MLARPEQNSQFNEPTEFRTYINLETKMLKNIIAIAVAAAFSTVAFAETTPTTPAKPVEVVKPAVATPAPWHIHQTRNG